MKPEKCKMFSQSRRQRIWDLSNGGANITLTPTGAVGGTPFFVTATQLGLVTVEQVLDVHLTTETPAVGNVTVQYQLAGTSTGIGGTVTSSAGTTVGLQVLAMGY